MRTIGPLLALALLVGAAPGHGQILGPDATGCMPGGGPAILATITGLKDRTGELKLELYPANEQDFLKDDRDLIQQGKTFRRVHVPTPAAGPTALCIRVPHPGRYALLFTHNRDGKNKFSIWQDGAGFPSNRRLGRSRPKVGEALIDVGSGVAVVTIRAQYLRGLGGFGFAG